MKRMKDNAIDAVSRIIAISQSKTKAYTIDESNRPISFNMGFIPLEIVTNQKVRWNKGGGEYEDETISLSGFFANSEGNAYKEFIDNPEQSGYDMWGIFNLSMIESSGTSSYVIGLVNLTHDENGKVKIRYCNLVGYQGDDSVPGSIEIDESGEIQLSIFNKN